MPLFLPSADKERTEELLKAIHRKTVTLDTLRYNPLPLSSSPPAPTDGEIHFEKHIQAEEETFFSYKFLSGDSPKPKQLLWRASQTGTPTQTPPALPLPTCISPSTSCTTTRSDALGRRAGASLLLRLWLITTRPSQWSQTGSSSCSKAARWPLR